MTREELGILPFEWVSHLHMADRYVSVYKNDRYGIILHQITKKKNDFETGKSKQIYFYKGKDYKSVDSLLEAMNKKE